MEKELNEYKILTAKQALEIDKLRAELGEAEEKLKKIHLNLICIGGPLNDNYHRYSPAQLKVFFSIENIIEGNQ